MSDSKASKRGRLPLHLEISEMLAREIKAGILMDGERLEPERHMAKRLGTAVGTLRKSLAVLVENGMLERIQGSGNYVRNVEVNTTIYGFFRLELLAGGGLPSATTLSVKRKTGRGYYTFGVKDDYYRIRRVRYLNDIPVALEEIWLDASYALEPLSKRNLSDSLYQFYKEQLGFWIARVEDSISMKAAPKWQPSEITKDASKQWGFVERNSWDQQGRQVEFSKTWFDTKTTRYVARWK
ncbi:GntR family transcriptional regulator [Granulosicoccus sp.]|nr:GntR family transcriptional regulator [Granulosicoccus sp.]MDB4223277.1 GntR family transcriptional regulator [Granulosicoccus sp.]